MIHATLNAIRELSRAVLQVISFHFKVDRADAASPSLQCTDGTYVFLNKVHLFSKETTLDKVEVPNISALLPQHLWIKEN